MTSRELVSRCIEFRSPDRIPLCLEIDQTRPENRAVRDAIWRTYTTDIFQAMNADPEFAPSPAGEDEWGCVWESMGETMGEVTGIPLPDWDAFSAWKSRIPDMSLSRRYDATRALRKERSESYIMGGLGAVMMNLIYFRGYAGYMTDIHLERRNLAELVDLIYRNVGEQVVGYADAGCDAVIAWEDWGLQDRLMIDPHMWRDLFKAPMADMIRQIHDRGMHYILHSCGYIVDILDDLVEVGVDVLQLDQQLLMGFSKLEQYCGEICFCCSTDIQLASGNENSNEISAHCEEMAKRLANVDGGFMYKTYAQPYSVHIPLSVVETECATFCRVNPYRK